MEMTGLLEPSQLCGVVCSDPLRVSARAARAQAFRPRFQVRAAGLIKAWRYVTTQGNSRVLIHNRNAWVGRATYQSSSVIYVCRNCPSYVSAPPQVSR
jgi:hypothetical protein